LFSIHRNASKGKSHTVLVADSMSFLIVDIEFTNQKLYLKPNHNFKKSF